MRNAVVCSDALEFLKGLPGNYVHTCITSPPYFGLRDYGVDGQIGLESVPEEYISRLVSIFREVRRVLHLTGTLWIVIGDTYASSWPCYRRNVIGAGSLPDGRREVRPPRLGPGLKDKDLIGVPWMLAFALRNDGWWLRQCVVWKKPNVLPGSQTDRPTTDYEFIFLLAKNERYFYDYLAVMEPHESLWYDGRERPRVVNPENSKAVAMGKEWGGLRYPPEGRRLRSVWEIPTESFSAKKYGLDVEHYAVFPEALPERCIRLSTSEAGVCGKCGAPWVRVIEKEGLGYADRTFRSLYDGGSGHTHGAGKSTLSKVIVRRTVGWEPSCACGADTVPALVLDPFCGSGTTLAVAKRLNRDYLGCDLNPDYVRLAKARVDREIAQLSFAF